MPLYLQNGKLLNKTGTLGTSVGCCCEQTGACCAPNGSCSITTETECQCAVGRCCGPDTVTIRNGTETYRRYRQESRQACIDRGGTWRCGSFGPLSVEGYSGAPLCDNNAGTSESVFQGSGTVCSPNPCVKCCCVGNNVTIVQSAQDCTGNIAAVPSTAIAINKISFAVDWDGLTAVTGEWFPQGGGMYGASSYAEGGASFSCQAPLASEPFDASSRSFNVNFFGSTQSGFGQPNCASFDANLSFFFAGTYPSTGFSVIAQNFSGVALSLCRKQATIALDSNYYAWCSNPFSNSFTVEMIIAP